jgi:heat-inducible transcriptional repressor
MNRAPTRLLLCSLTSAVIVAAAADASAFPNPFKKKQLTAAPAATELRAAEIEAGDLLRQAQDAEAAGKSGTAASGYKRVVDRYPLTSFAPMAMFRLASTYEREGKFSKAFETYQELVDTYKQSAQFSESIDRQIAIATQSRTEKLGSFLGIPKKLDRSEQIDMFQKVISNAANLLSNLSQFVGVVMAPRRTNAFRHMEFLRLSDRRILVIIVSADGDVQNRIIFTEVDYSQSQLIEAANFLNSHYVGLDIEEVRSRLQHEVESLRTEIATLMAAAVNVNSEAVAQEQDEVVISGERNLLKLSDFSNDMGNLRRAFELFEQKAQIMRLLDIAGQAEGVRIFIGGESQVVPFEDLSIVSAPYEVDGKLVGTLGVIGPTRMPYDRMIQIVDITSKLVSNALSHHK